MSVPRGLTAEEAELWRRITATVTPLHRARTPVEAAGQPALSPAPPPVSQSPAKPAASARAAPRAPTPAPAPASPPARPLTRDGLDGTWERRLASARIDPEVILDLHGMNLAQAHDRLMGGLTQARAMGARVVLLVTGKPRPVEEHDQRGQRRGAIRAKLLDWLAASSHACAIAAVRPAHPRHGGAGAVYIVLRRAR